MKPLSIEPVFQPVMTPASELSALRAALKRARGPHELCRILADAPFAVSYDYLRSIVIESAAKDEVSRVLDTLTQLARSFAGNDVTDTSAGVDDKISALECKDIHTALLQLVTALHLELDSLDAAAASASEALDLLASQPRRKDSPFLHLLGSLLYDIAYLHSQRHEFKQAEREIEKSVKIFERLAKADPERYAPAQMMAIGAATGIYRNRDRQKQLLAQYQASTTEYLELYKAGVEDAALRLAESLGGEGDTLSRMGKHREAIQYYSRALKLLTKVEPEFSLAQLRLSVGLGQSMLAVGNMREKGVHLLNTMLHKATKINALDEHRQIVDSLYHAKSRSLDILSFWHKIFPR